MLDHLGGIAIRTILTNFIRFNAQNVNKEVLLVLCTVYGVLLVLTLISIFSRNKGGAFKAGWCFLTVFVPVGGIALYCLSCILSVDKTLLERLKRPRHAKHGSDRIPNTSA